MPRRGNVPKREILPDPVYNSVLVTKLINSIMLDGKKGVAQKVVYDAFDIIKNKSGKDPLEAFTEAMNNIMPSLEVKARRVGGATYQVPIEVRPERRQTLGLRWLTNYSRARSENTTGSPHSFESRLILTFFSGSLALSSPISKSNTSGIKVLP